MRQITFINRILLALCVMHVMPLESVSLVYNIKIRRTFDTSNIPGIGKYHWFVTALPIIYKQKAHIINGQTGLDIFEKRDAAGSLFNFRYIPSRSWWGEITTGIEKEKAHAHGTLNRTISRKGFDDVVISGGYNYFLNKATQFVFYGIAGFPTKRSVSLQDAQGALVGTRFYSLGFGTELSYAFFNEPKQTFVGIFQNRLIHFFSRNWSPILAGNDNKIEPGNLTDVVCAGRYRFRKTIWEAGYNATFWTQQAIVVNGQKTTTPNATRQSGYMRYSYLVKKFPVLSRPVLWGWGVNLSRIDRFDIKAVSAFMHISTPL